MVKENLIPIIEVPNTVIQKWQSFADIMAQLLKVPAGLIMRITEPDIEVFVSSLSDNNPYKIAILSSIYYAWQTWSPQLKTTRFLPFSFAE